jgi:hypothetical protein
MRSYKGYFAVVIALAVAIFVAMAVDVPIMGLGLLILALLGVVVALFVQYRAENQVRYQAPPQPAYQPPPPPPPVSTPVQGLVLPSAHRDYRFLLNVTVMWRHSSAQGITHLRPEQLAVDAIRERAATFAERESASDSDVLAPRLAADLSSPRPDRTGQLEVWAQDVVLGIPDDDRERFSRLARIRKDEEVWEHERAYERNKRAYLREDVLSSTGSAVVWWLAKDTERVEQTVNLIGAFTKLVAAAHDREVGPVLNAFVDNLTDPLATATPDSVDQLLAQLLPTGSEQERALMADRLATLAAEFGRTDLARTLRERFNAPDFTEEELIPDGALHTNGQANP